MASLSAFRLMRVFTLGLLQCSMVILGQDVGGNGGGRESGNGTSTEITPDPNSTYAKAAKAYEESRRTANPDVVNYYRQLLDVVCLRIAQNEERDSEYCASTTKSAILPLLSVCSYGKEPTRLEEKVLSDLVDSVYDKVDQRARNLEVYAGEVASLYDNRQCLPPALSVIRTIARLPNPNDVGKAYVRGFALNEELQPYIKSYINTALFDLKNSTVLARANEILYAHTKLYDCGIAPSLSLMSQRDPDCMCKSLVARHFTALYAEQLRDNFILFRAEEEGLAMNDLQVEAEGEPLKRREIDQNVELINKDAPLDLNLRSDTRNYVDREKVVSEGYYQNYSPLASSYIGYEFSREHQAYEARRTGGWRGDARGETPSLILAGAVNQFSLTPDKNIEEGETTPAVGIAAQIRFDANLLSAPTGLTQIWTGDPNSDSEQGISYPSAFILGDLNLGFNAVQDLSPRFDEQGFLLAPARTKLLRRDITEFYSEFNGSQLLPPSPSRSIFLSAWLSISYDFSLLGPGASISTDNLYLLDVLNGTEIPSQIIPINATFGYLKGYITPEKGAWGCGWGGGGIYAIGVKPNFNVGGGHRDHAVSWWILTFVSITVLGFLW